MEDGSEDGEEVTIRPLTAGDQCEYFDAELDELVSPFLGTAESVFKKDASNKFHRLKGNSDSK